MNREQELWAIALWLEKHHGDAAPAHIAEKITRLATSGDKGGIKLWRSVAERYDQLRERRSAS